MNKFTSFLKKRKAFVIVALIGMILGFTVLGTTQEDINKLKAEKTTVLAKIDSSQEELSTLNKDIGDLKEKINQLNDEKQKQEQLLKDTTAKVELKQKEEAEKQRQAEIEKQKQEEANSISQSSSNNSSKKSTSNNSSNAKSNSYNSDNPQPSKPVGEMVYITATGKKYHRKNKCGNTNPARTSYIPLSEAESMGYTPCSKCY
ncbi:coiled-coil domain-containing protein [Clostridium perfringens]|uniref:coiled-coil domain-containing protein n=1 Tax=Clostridium perfringens TaxID=1502 RepID=UPI0039E90FDD